MEETFLIRLLTTPAHQATRITITILVFLFLSYQNIYDFPGEDIWVAFFATFVCFTLPVVINIYLLIPRYLEKKRYLIYSFWLILNVMFWIVLLGSAFNVLYSLKINDHDYDFTPYSLFHIIVVFCLIVVCTTTIELFRRWMVYDRKIAELDKTTVQTELQQLQNQINPHFLFNMINNANTLVEEDPKQAMTVLGRLKELIDYQFQDSVRQKIFLRDDVRFLENFLELEKIRRDQFEYHISLGDKTEQVQVPPLLFIPFVENAVKYSQDSEKISYVYLLFSVEEEKLTFICRNSRPEILSEVSQGGIGLQNIKRRLELLFGNSYRLDLIETEHDFTVNLELKL